MIPHCAAELALQRRCEARKMNGPEACTWCRCEKYDIPKQPPGRVSPGSTILYPCKPGKLIVAGGKNKKGLA